jgi:hypothetical protein
MRVLQINLLDPFPTLGPYSDNIFEMVDFKSLHKLPTKKALLQDEAIYVIL